MIFLIIFKAVRREVFSNKQKSNYFVATKVFFVEDNRTLLFFTNHSDFKFFLRKIRASKVFSLKWDLNLVTNIPEAEKARSASTEVGGRVFIAQNTFSRIAGRSPVFSKIVSSLFSRGLATL